jgi:hypothetical protein
MDTIPQQKRKSRLDRVLTPGDFVARVLLSAHTKGMPANKIIRGMA